MKKTKYMLPNLISIEYCKKQNPMKFYTKNLKTKKLVPNL